MGKQDKLAPVLMGGLGKGGENFCLHCDTPSSGAVVLTQLSQICVFSLSTILPGGNYGITWAKMDYPRFCLLHFYYPKTYIISYT